MAIIDPPCYNRSEAFYKSQMPIPVRQAFSLEVFEKFGFPTSVESINDLRPFLDTMQDGRLKDYFDELGGYSQYDAQEFVRAIRVHFEFQRKYFPNKELIVPLDIISSGLLVAKKLKYFLPQVKNIIEFGPGAAGTSLFLKSYLPSIKNITYVEA